jgi:hypothetical protein
MDHSQDTADVGVMVVQSLSGYEASVLRLRGHGPVSQDPPPPLSREPSRRASSTANLPPLTPITKHGLSFEASGAHQSFSTLHESSRLGGMPEGGGEVHNKQLGQASAATGKTKLEARCPSSACPFS